MLRRSALPSSADRLAAAALARRRGAGRPHAAGRQPPRRIVSLDLCTDQLLVELVRARAHRRRDASGRPTPAVSAIPEKARGIPITHGGAEDVLRYDPDLVLAGPFGVRGTVDLLQRLGRSVVVVPQPQDLAGVRARGARPSPRPSARRQGRGA